MSQNISWLDNDYENVTYTALPKTGGGEATFYDVSDTTATASDVLDTAYFYTAQGVRTKGTNSGGGLPNLQDKTNISPSTSSQTIRADSGYDGLSSVQINAMPTQTLPTSTTSSGTGTTKATVSRSTSDQYINIPTGYNSTAVNYKISAVANGSAGTPTATKGTVSNHAITVTPSVTNTTGYIIGSTINGTAVTVSASELDSGSKSITANGNSQDVVGYASVDVAVPNNYSASDEGKVVSSGALVSQTAHADVTPTTSDQTIDTTTNNSIKVKGDADLVAGNIKKDVEIFGVTGSYEGSSPSPDPYHIKVDGTEHFLMFSHHGWKNNHATISTNYGNRRSVWAGSGDTEVYYNTTTSIINLHLIPVPANVTTISVTIDQTCQLDLHEYWGSGANLTSHTALGWTNITASTPLSITLSSGSAYIGVSFRVNSGSTNYTPATEPQNVSIDFT